jgi:hypothetical protein
MAGVVKNRSSITLWVVNTDCREAFAYKLAPGYQSPDYCDADGFKSTDGTTVDGHTSWVKVTSISTADVRDKDGGGLTRGCIACYDVGESEFGRITFSNETWGDKI